MMRNINVVMAAVVVLAVAGVASAVPMLQLYTPGGTYDYGVDTWVVESNPLLLAVVGAKSPEKVDWIEDISLYIAVSQESYNPTGSITIQGTGPRGDVAAINYTLGAGGLAPTGNGTPAGMPAHDVYPAYYWAVSLPDLYVATAGEIVPDYQPGQTGTDDGETQYYWVSYAGFDAVHFDVWGVGINGIIHPQFAPFSHDAEGRGGDGGSPIPEPATMVLMGLGLGGAAWQARRRTKKCA